MVLDGTKGYWAKRVWNSYLTFYSKHISDYPNYILAIISNNKSNYHTMILYIKRAYTRIGGRGCGFNRGFFKMFGMVLGIAYWKKTLNSNNETFSFIMLYNSYVRWGGGGESPIEEHTWDRIHIRWCVCEGGTVIFTQNLYLVTYWHYDKRSIFALDKIYISRIYMCCCTKDLQIYDSKLNHLSSTQRRNSVFFLDEKKQSIFIQLLSKASGFLFDVWKSAKTNLKTRKISVFNK